MPQRILRDWTDSQTIEKLKFEEEVLFTRLIMKADDYGNYHANPQMVKSLLFPLKDGLRVTDIDRWLKNLEAAGLIRTYTAKGSPFLHIVNFGQRLRQRKHIFPCQQPDSDLSASGALEEKRREEEVEEKEKGNSPPEPNEFLSLENCKERYLKIQQAAIEQICTSKNLSREKILFWLDEFHKQLISEGVENKIYHDYVKHFARWINIKDLSKSNKTANSPANYTEKL